MYIEVGRKCNPNMKFDVPHKGEPMLFKKLEKKFPDFVKIFDGESIENTMCFYWKRNKQTGVYEFIDSESEEEVAELMGVQLYDGVDENEEDLAEQRQLTQDEIQSFKEELVFVKQALETSGFKK